MATVDGELIDITSGFAEEDKLQAQNGELIGLGASPPPTIAGTVDFPITFSKFNIGLDTP